MKIALVSPRQLGLAAQYQELPLAGEVVKIAVVSPRQLGWLPTIRSFLWWVKP